MKDRVDPNFRVLDFIQAVRKNKPQDADNLKRILTKIIPAVAAMEGQVVEGELDDESFATLAANMPANRLLNCIDKEGKAWDPSLIAAMPELAHVPAYKNDYRRCLLRCLKHAVARNLISTAVKGVSPPFQEAREYLFRELPTQPALLQERLDRGETELHGHSLIAKSFKQTRLLFRSICDSFNELGRYMTSQGVLDPLDVQQKHLFGTPSSWFTYRLELNPAAMTGYYRSRFAWEILRTIKPEMNLVAWPQQSEGKAYSLNREKCPSIVTAIISVLAKDPNLTASTVENITIGLERLLGVLHNKFNIDIHALAAMFEDPKDFCHILLAGYPPTTDGREPNPEQEIQRILTDPEYRQQVLDGAVLANHRHAYKGACRRNPFLVLFERWMIERKTPSVLEVALKGFRILGDRYLRVDESQKKWLSDMLNQSVASKKMQPPSVRAKRKQAVAMDVDLWKKLVEARSRLTANTEILRNEMEAILSKPKATDRQKNHARMRWAVAVRDELMVAFLLCFCLRKENIQGMRIGHEIFPADYRVSIPPSKAKAKDWINKHFPSGGYFGDMKALLDHYMDKARPILLAGREDTPYLFLTVSKGNDARDKDGYLRGHREHLPQIVGKLCLKHFKDILPPGVDIFNVHLARDMFSAYVYPKPGGEALVSQGLANTAAVTRINYLKHQHQNDSGVLAFVETDQSTKGTRGRSDALRERESYRKEAIKILGPDAPHHQLHQLMKTFDRHR